MLVNRDNLNSTYHQQDSQSCLLSSYAVVGNYFLRDDIESFFQDYYNEYINDFTSQGINYLWSQFRYNQYIHINNLGRRSGRSGFKILLDLYTDSEQSVFVKSRNTFHAELVKINNLDGTIIDGKYNETNVNDFLGDPNQNNMLNVFINRFDGNNYNHVWDKIIMHSITVYFNDGLFFHDTGNQPHNDKSLPQNWWNLPRIGDVLLFWEK